MEYLTTFLEGLISFISPCMLPMIPIYVSYFAGDNGKKNNLILNAIAFVLGFTVVFCMVGVFAGALGGFVRKYEYWVNIFCGLIVVLFGLNYLDVIKINIFKPRNNKKANIKGFFSAFIFGVIFSINLTPCTGVFLGSALLLASTSGTVFKGMLLLLIYSMGLGVPIILSVILIKKISSVFNFIKKNYKIINIISGVFLIIIGILIMFGILNNILPR